MKVKLLVLSLVVSLVFSASVFAEDSPTDRTGIDPSTQPTKMLMSAASSTPTALTVTSSNANALVNTLLGGGVTVSNVKVTGSSVAVGNFSGGDTIIGFPSGIILSSGAAVNVRGPNSSTNVSRINSTAGDADLNNLGNISTYDSVALEFDFVPNNDIISFQYVFASDEYNEYANSDFNDVFGFFLNGKNVALVPGTTLPVSINTINGGNPIGTNAKNPQWYINNDMASGAKRNTSMDGLTKVLPVEVEVKKGQVNHMKLAIADGGDMSYDSNVFIKAGSFTDKPIDHPPVVTAATDRAPNADGWFNNDVIVTFTATDEQPLASVDPPVTVSTEGANQVITGTATDSANQVGTGSITVSIDKTAPTTTANVPAANENGLYKSDVAVSMTASDALSGVSGTQYRLNGTAWQPYSSPIMLSTEGTITVDYQSTDKAGNMEEVKSLSVSLDKTAPTATVAYDNNTVPINKDVVATITPSEVVTITNNNGSTNYTFSENGSFTFEFVDAAGNTGTATATVSNIDKVAPTATVAYDNTAPTNNDVAATITPSEVVTITNNNGSASHTFSENGSFTFEFVDAAGNTGTATATVSNIDKVPPTATVAYSTTDPTNNDVAATITPSEVVTITNNNGSASHTFSENGSFTFEFVDAAGNTGTATATVSNIDKVPPTATVAYDNTAPTNNDVAATITPSEVVTITNNNGSASYTFSENGSFTFEFVDAAGNTGMATATVTNIDKTAPTLKIVLDKTVINIPNRKMVPIHATLTPEDTGSGIASVVLTSIVSSDPENTKIEDRLDKELNDYVGKFPKLDNLLSDLRSRNNQADIQGADYGTLDTTFELRAELSSWQDRIYTITYTVTDNAGNSSTATATVTVTFPKDIFKKWGRDR